MSIINSLFQWVGSWQSQATAEKKAAVIHDYPAWLLAQASADQYAMPDLSLPSNQLELYQQLSWVAIAVNAVSSTAAITDMNVRQKGELRAKEIPNHPFLKLLDNPNPLQSRYELLEATAAHYDITGNAYWWLNRPDAKTPPEEVWFMPSDKVIPVPDGHMYLRGYLYDAGVGVPLPLEPWEVMHFKTFNPRSSYIGLSKIESLAIIAEGDLAMQRWNTGFFSEDHAKLPGALAFSDMVPNPQWLEMKNQIREQHGGTKRSLMMLRGIGTGGVQWIPMAMSQKDMEFLQARQLTKEEIFAMFAPGLASTLAINATEANSTAGRATFLELAVWPKLVSIGQKITNTLLPCYGANQEAYFVDIRHTDKAMAISQQAAFALVHTIDEVRAEYYNADPIGDERGELLLAQVSQGTFGVVEEVQEQPLLEGVAPLEVPESDDADSDDPELPELPETEIEEPKDVEEEVAKFKRWATSPKRKQHVNPLKFSSTLLSESDKVGYLVKWGLLKADDPLEQLPLLDPNQVPALYTTNWHDLMATLEEETSADVAAALRLQQSFLFEKEPTSTDEVLSQIPESSLRVRDILEQRLREATDLGASVGISQVQGSGYGFDWTLVHSQAREWAKQHAGELIRQLDETTSTIVREAVGAWITNGLPMSALIQELERSAFSRRRAEMIAVNELTRAYAQGARQAFLSSGVVTKWKWETAADDMVCAICLAFNGTVVAIDEDFAHEVPQEVRDLLREDTVAAPPAHMGCRCWVTPVIESVNYRVLESGATTTDLNEKPTPVVEVAPIPVSIPTVPPVLVPEPIIIPEVIIEPAPIIIPEVVVAPPPAPVIVPEVVVAPPPPPVIVPEVVVAPPLPVAVIPEAIPTGPNLGVGTPGEVHGIDTPGWTWYRPPTSTAESQDGNPTYLDSEASAQKKALSEWLAKELKITAKQASEFLATWAADSNGEDMRHMSIQYAASQLFGTQLSPWQQALYDEVRGHRNEETPAGINSAALYFLTHPYEYNPSRPWSKGPFRTEEAAVALVEKTLTLMHNKTQEELKAAGMTEVMLYRGFHMDLGNAKPGEIVQVKGNALESWTLSRDLASNFAIGEHGHVISMTVPIERVVATARTGIGCLGEYEFVLSGTPNGQTDHARLVE